MKVLLICCIASILIFATHGNRIIRPHFDGRIVGGEPTTIEEYPYQVSVQYYGDHLCGGSILSSNVIITAAHCTDGLNSKRIEIRAGTTTYDNGGVLKSIQQYYIPESFNYYTVDYDVSLIVLNESLEFSSTIQPITLPNESEYLEANESAVVTGWGAEKSGAASLPKILRKVVVPIVDQSACIEAYAKIHEVTERMVCAGYLGEGGKDSCQSDSGGPLMANNKLHGIVSWGQSCGDKNYPGVYARVTALRGWIRSKVNL